MYGGPISTEHVRLEVVGWFLGVGLSPGEGRVVFGGFYKCVWEKGLRLREKKGACFLKGAVH